ncbi:hypothetical protein GOE04_16370 [Sinorhizobium medicae]|nr:hypothetical protein [Sinorhizobium medicae]MDX0921168.1 hypothetical protein [Sinorhizobium medicae]MDX0935039.1 hypothetical protein [Sinorhizobium medicae]MDX0941386.1 hypothetical protein [Sinorhizobium medicae]MDX1029234.1 hypothetical protein [Sinorhizobium medicae]
MLLELKSQLAAAGFVLLNSYRPGADVVDVAEELGETLTPWEGGLVQTLSPRAQGDPNTYSGNFGLGAFPFHTDLAHWRIPPRYLVLRCVTGYADVPTSLVDGNSLVEALSRSVLARAIFKPRRPRDGAYALLRLLEDTADGRHLLRWDELFLQPASPVGGKANDLVREWLSDCQPMSVALAQPDDTLIIDNWRMLHARSPVLAGREDRAIQRVYLRGLN